MGSEKLSCFETCYGEMGREAHILCSDRGMTAMRRGNAQRLVARNAREKGGENHLQPEDAP